MRTKLPDRAGITSTKEDYIRAIYILNKSARDGLAIAAPYAQVELTPKGVSIGKQLTYKHRLIEVFLHQTLKMPKDQVHAEAERLEHAFSDEAIKRLDTFLKHPSNDPHGSPITH